MNRTWIPFLGFLFLGITLLTTLQSFTTVDDLPTVRCYADEIHETRMETDSIYARAQREFPTTVAIQRATSNETFVIPTVVHVFHNGEPYGVNSNVSDEQIYEAIDGLNAAFAGAPFFESEYDGGFTHPYNNANIEFCLATIDPDGNTTTGITRHFPDSIAGYLSEGMTTTSLSDPNHEHHLKALAHWPVSDYMNVYVVHKLNGGLSPLGFAYLPPVTAYYDGIVSVAPVFGYTEGSAYTLNNYGRNGTLIHEVGHYLGLHHTFNFTSSCGTETNCSAQGDKCCDTPKTTGSAGCGPLECPETMVENYMDYSNDNCTDRFSPDQIERMRTQLVSYRSSLLDNGKCSALDQIDVSATSINIPNQGACTEVYSGINFNMNSFSLDTITHVDIIYKLDNESPQMFTWNGELTLGNPVNVTLPEIEIPFGPHTLNIWAYNPNFTPDSNPDNDNVSIDFVNPEGVTTNIVIDFDPLPYGFAWELYEAEEGDPIGDPIAFNDEYTNPEYACTSEIISFCLPEGDYVLVLTDLFGNGMHYPCNGGEYVGYVGVEVGEGTLTSANGNWGASENLPFTITTPCPPHGDCKQDVDGDGLVGVGDILIALNYFGSYQVCHPVDMDQDGVIDVDDLLDILSYFGWICGTEFTGAAEIPQAIREMIEERTGIDMGTTEVGEFDFTHPLPISINPYQIESMQDVVAVRYYDVSGRQINKENVSQGIYIARIVMMDGSLETIKFYSQQ